MKRTSLVSLVALSFSLSAAIAGEALQNVDLNVGTLAAKTEVPQSWGASYSIDPESAGSAEVAIPVMEGVPYKTAAWDKVVPVIDEYKPSITITVVDLSGGFKDDGDMKLPEDERPPNALSAKQKEATIVPLETIYKASAVDVEKFRAPEMEQIPDLEGAWWGGLTGVLDILDIQYIENADKSLRGVSFLYTEGGDINFSVSSRVLLYSPELKTVAISDVPLFSFPEIKKLNEAVGAAGEGPAILEQYRKGLTYIRDRKAWASTPMAKLVEQQNEAAKALIVVRK